MLVDLAPDLPENDLDSELFYRALLNILMNAIQAMHEHGCLQVSTRAMVDGATELKIKDNGVGIAPEKIDQIFLPFFSDKNKGTGLGLAITKNILDNHGAEVVVQSTEGQETTFIITLPPAKQ